MNRFEMTLVWNCRGQLRAGFEWMSRVGSAGRLQLGMTEAAPMTGMIAAGMEMLTGTGVTRDRIGEAGTGTEVKRREIMMRPAQENKHSKRVRRYL
jgi:hypothetical protein